MNKRLKCLLSVMLGAGLSLSCERVEEPLPEPLRPVRYQEVFASGGIRERIFTGAARAGIESKISFKVPGTLEQLVLDEGDSAKQGQLIAQLDPRDYQLQVEEAEASLAHARAQAVNAQAEYSRVVGLYERNNASQSDYDASLAAQDSARAQVSAIEKRLESARLQLTYTRLESPIDGMVAEVPVEVNENIQRGQTIVVINAGARPEVEVAIPEVLIGEIQPDSRVVVRFDAYPDREFTGHVAQLGVAATQGLKTYPVTIRLNRADPRILPGMAAEVRFRFGAAGGAPRWILPPHAVGEDDQGTFVFVLEPDDEEVGKVRRRSVEVGELVGEGAVPGLEVLAGLRDGERVVTVGVSRIADGQRVRIQNSD